MIRGEDPDCIFYQKEWPQDFDITEFNQV